MKTNISKYQNLCIKLYHSKPGRVLLGLMAIVCLFTPVSSYAADALAGLGLQQAASDTFGSHSVFMGLLFIGEFVGLVLLYITGPKNPKIFTSIIFLMIVVPVGFTIAGQF